MLFALVFGPQTGRASDQILQEKASMRGQSYVPGEIIVKFRKGLSKAAAASMISKHGAVTLRASRRGGFKRLKIPKGKKVSELVQIYRKDPRVEYVEPNYIARASLTPNDRFYEYQWHMDNPEYGGIHMGEAWDVSTGSGVNVAVIDTGVAYEDYDDGGEIFAQAPDLADTSFVAGYDFVNDDSHPNDDHGHGTHVTGTIAQSTGNGIGVAGVAFDCSIMPIKVLDSAGWGTHANIADGIYFAADNGAKVINLSLGGPADSTTLRDAVDYAYSKGVTIVAAAGNEGSTTISYPAAYDDSVIAVGATRYDEALASYSNHGASLDLTAPGGDLSVDQNEDGYVDGVLQQTFSGSPTNFAYWFYAGTSMAAPHVAGVAALVIANGVTGPDAVRDVLEATADDLGASGWDGTYGWGLVNAAAALADPAEEPPGVPAGEDFVLSRNADFSTDDREFTTTDTLYILAYSEFVDFNNLKKKEYKLEDSNKRKVQGKLTNHFDGTYTISISLTDLALGAVKVNIKLEDNDKVKFQVRNEFISIVQGFDGEPPGVPGDLTAAAVSENQIDLTWAPSSDNVGVAGYNVFRDGTQVGTSEATAFSDTGLQPSITYTYQVQAVDAAENESDLSAAVSATTLNQNLIAPATPTDLSATAFSGTQINLTWTESSDKVGVAGYNIFVRDGSQVGTSQTSSFSDTGLEPSTIYEYQVQAFDAAGNLSSLSNWASATTLDEISDEGVILSKNADFSTNDREFATTDTLYIMVHSAFIDFSNLRKNEYKIEDVNRKRIKGKLTNHNDGTYRASISLSSLIPGTAKVNVKLEDGMRKKFQLRNELITIISAP